jgi:hypothetical protein
MRDLPIRIAIMAAALLVAAVGITATGVFLCLALYEYLLTHFNPTVAALITAAGVFVLSLVILWIGSALSKSVAKQARREREKHGGNLNAISAELGQALGASAQGFIAKKPILSLIVALAGGFAIGASPRLRAFLQNFLRN